ncbi:methyltransferase [Synechococcus sp. PCC 6312]|uniref:methyltransferase n=1 Tax=Synechococcus sp. (strain ATCC 27167 / PCC 6312) TaxID=195253 RepID=UPI00029F0999|nr:methyltransferase [Synechococcus sp. PCC 6312]AFY62730.1 hydroxyneurosporene-O-methyltransferase [Synechococcus sp. PCC 6312]
MTPATEPETLSPMAESMASPPPQMVLMQMITGYWVSQSIFAAAKLGLADHLSTGEKNCAELATATGSHEPSLYRLLRALASVGIFAETKPSTFAITPLATFLRSDVPGSVRDASIMMGDQEHYGSWGNILHAIKTGDSSFQDRFGMNIFDYYGQNPEAANIFDRAMTSFSSPEIAGVISDYDFSGIKSLVDVAGGQGSLLTAILQANPTMTGTLFDMPDVIERAKSHIADSPVSERCQLVSGSFFESVPAGADAYILKHIIHDWDDQRAIAILKQCHQAMAANGKVLVVEQVIPPGNDPFIGKFLDVNMLVMCPGGKERTAAEFQALFAQAGFKLTRIVPTHGIVSVIEGMRLS